MGILSQRIAELCPLLAVSDTRFMAPKKSVFPQTLRKLTRERRGGLNLGINISAFMGFNTLMHFLGGLISFTVIHNGLPCSIKESSEAKTTTFLPPKKKKTAEPLTEVKRKLLLG